MPTYDYQCNACEHIFDRFSSISARDEPCAEPCGACKSETVKRGVPSTIQTGVDATLTANKATGGQWGELMSRMQTAPGIRKKDSDHLEVASSRTGKKMGPR